MGGIEGIGMVRWDRIEKRRSKVVHISLQKLVVLYPNLFLFASHKSSNLRLRDEGPFARPRAPPVELSVHWAHLVGQQGTHHARPARIPFYKQKPSGYLGQVSSCDAALFLHCRW